jgi:plastocyanin
VTSRARLAVAAVVVVALAVFVAGRLIASGGSQRPAKSSVEAANPTYVYVIPAGTGAAVDRGEPVDILPRELRARVGEVMRIVNDDDRGHLVGPFFVAAGQTLTQRFNSPGELVGVCSIHEDGLFVLEIVP